MRGQISLEFTLYMVIVVLSSIIVGYYLIKTGLTIRDTSVSLTNESANTAKELLSRVE
ncbi:class III signal peptide-containing protein [Methanocaldococcus sp.]